MRTHLLFTRLLCFLLASATVSAFAQKSPMEHAKVWLGIHAGIRSAEQYALRVISPVLGEPDLHYAWYNNHGGLNTVAESPKVMVQITPGVKYWMYVSSASWRYADVHFNPPPGYVIKLSGSWLERTPRLTHRTNDYNGSYGTYYVDFELVPQDGVTTLPAGYARPPSVGDITWAVSAGHISTGASASALRWRATTVTQGLLDALALRFSDVNHDEVYTYAYSDGAPKYLSTEQAQLYVRRNAGANSGYTIEAYGPYVSYSYANNDPANDWTFASAPFATYAIANPDASWLGRVRITRTQDGVTETWTLAQSGSTTTLEQSNSLQKITLASSTVTSTAVGEIYPGDPSGTSYRREIATVTDAAGNNLATKAVRYYRGFVWGEELVREVANPDGTNGSPLTTSYTYYDSGWAGGSFSGNVTKLKSVTSPDGSWTKYEYYDAFASWGQLKAVYRPWQDSAGVTADNASPTNCHYTSFTYTAERDIFQELLLATETRVLGTTTAKTEVASYGIWNNNDYITFPNQVQQIRDETVRTYTAAGSYLTTNRRVFHKSSVLDYEGKLFSQTNPDGTKVSATYVKGHFSSYFHDPALWDNALFTPGNSNTWWCDSFFTGTAADPGGATQVTTWNGKSIDPVWMTPNRSTRRDVLRAIDGTMGFEITYLYTGGGSYKIIDWSYAEYANGLVTVQRDRTGAVVTRTYTAGRVSYETAADGTQTQYYFDDLRRVTRSERKGVAATAGFPAQDAINTYYTYDAANRVVATSTSPGAGGLTLSTATSYNPAGQLLSQTASTGLVTTFSYTNGGRTVTTTHPGGATTVTERYVDGSTKSVTGSAQVASTQASTVNGDGTITLTTYAGPSGTSSPRWSKVTTDWAGRAYWQQSPTTTAGVTFNKVSIFNTVGQLVRVEETNLANTLYQYDGLGELEYTALDVNGNGSIDLAGPDRVTRTRSSVVNNGGVWSAESLTYVYNQDGSATPILTGRALRRLVPYLGSSTDFSNFRVLTESRSYDVHGNETIGTLSVDRSTRIATSTTNVPDSSVDAVETTFNGLKVRSQTPQNLTYHSYYDALGRLVKQTDPRTDTSSTPRIGYYTSGAGSIGQVAWKDDAAGNRTNYNYNWSDGRLNSEVNPQGKAIYYTYTARGQLNTQWGAATYPVAYDYSVYGERTAMATYRGGSGWDQPTWPSAPGTSDVTVWAYDPATGTLTSKTDAANKTISYTYTARGQLATRTWARGVTTSYSYSAATGEQTGISYSDGTPSLAYTYNRLGQTATVVDATGTRTFAYSPTTTLLASEALPAFFGSRVLSRNYDTSTTGALGRPTGYTLTASATEQSVAYGYDAYGRFNSLADTGLSATFSYAYTTNSNLLATVTHLGYQQAWTFEPNRDLLSSASTTLNGATQAGFAYTNDTLGRRTAVTKSGAMFSRYSAGGIATNWGYNDRSEVTAESTVLAGTATAVPGRNDAYVYDNIGNRATTTHNGNTATYTANALNQYSQRTVPGHVDVSGLAPAAASVTVNGSSTGVNRAGDYYFLDYAASNTSALWPSLTVASSYGGSTTRNAFIPATLEVMTHDLDGNLTSDGRWDYTYDAENRLVSMQTHTALSPSPFPNTEARRLEFKYDYLGRRAEKLVRAGYNGSVFTSVPTQTRYIYDGWNLVAEYNAVSSLSLTRTFVWGLDWSGTLQGAGGVGGLRLIRDYGTGDTYLPAYDGNGNVMALVSRNTGVLAACYEYDAYGQTIRADGAYSAANSFRFSTKYTDTESGLVYYGLRYYSPSLGRFVNRDPKEEGGGLNLYAFCHNNGVGRWDYLGLDDESYNRFLASMYRAMDDSYGRAQAWQQEAYGRTHSNMMQGLAAGTIQYGSMQHVWDTPSASQQSSPSSSSEQGPSARVEDRTYTRNEDGTVTMRTDAGVTTTFSAEFVDQAVSGNATYVSDIYGVATANGATNIKLAPFKVVANPSTRTTPPITVLPAEAYRQAEQTQAYWNARSPATAAQAVYDFTQYKDSFDLAEAGAVVVANTAVEVLFIIEAPLLSAGRARFAPKECFPAGTIVATLEGDVKIEDIEVGDTVWAYDFETGKSVARKVTELKRNFTHYWVDVQVDGETIQATRSHPFWVESEKRWIEASDLKSGMSVRLLDGTTRVVSGVDVREVDAPEKTYNFEVEVDHNYFVGHNHVLVHNPSPNFIVTPSGQVFPVPSGASGPVPVINPAGNQTGVAFTGGAGGANGQVSTMRMMDPTPPRGASPGYPDGYIKYENAAGQGVDPNTGRTLPNSQSHYKVEAVPRGC